MSTKKHFGFIRSIKYAVVTCLGADAFLLFDFFMHLGQKGYDAGVLIFLLLFIAVCGPMFMAPCIYGIVNGSNKVEDVVIDTLR